MINKQKIINSLNKSLRNSVKDYVISVIKNNLYSNKKYNGKPQPNKAESTKKIYAKHGWDKYNYLVRKGEMTPPKFRYKINELVFFPTDQSVSKYHPKEVTDLYNLTDTHINQIKTIIEREFRYENII